MCLARFHNPHPSEVEDLESEFDHMSRWNVAHGQTGLITECSTHRMLITLAMLNRSTTLPVVQACMHTYSLVRVQNPHPSEAEDLESEFDHMSRVCSAILVRAHDYGGTIYFLAVSTLSDMINLDPTLYHVVARSGLPRTFLTSLRAGVLPHFDAGALHMLSCSHPSIDKQPPFPTGTCRL